MLTIALSLGQVLSVNQARPPASTSSNPTGSHKQPRNSQDPGGVGTHLGMALGRCAGCPSPEEGLNLRAGVSGLSRCGARVPPGRASSQPRRAESLMSGEANQVRSGFNESPSNVEYANLFTCLKHTHSILKLRLQSQHVAF